MDIGGRTAKDGGRTDCGDERHSQSVAVAVGRSVQIE